ncbi:hypothetical protein AB0G79_14525 [Streptomyces sp. NPDC020807]|uniref:hypothetical protein n=1 Tax=Streptomyces sp. NPDC020807 TaxID=3155119 RepID=UPI0033F55297
MIESLPSDVDVPGDVLLAGYFVALPERLHGAGLPRAERLTSASACVIDQFPADGCWFATAREALAACRPLPLPAEARLYALLVPSEDVGGLVADILAARTDEPVLLARLGGQGSGEAAPRVPEGGHELGWEVLGYDGGLLHTWLCNDLYEDGRLDLGVETDERGLLPDRQTARRVAAWANGRGDTKPVTWFPGTLIEWDILAWSRFGPV